jgi:serine/threonine protein kinase
VAASSPARQPRPWPCALGAGLAEGLTAIHACGLVHRDLKPSNVILAEDGPRIIDFGIARAAQAGPMTTTGFVVGTYSYMSPEQMRCETAGPASDVFSLGCTLAFAASARAPFGDESIVTVVHRITSEPPDLSDVTQERGFRQLISECLAKSAAGSSRGRAVFAASDRICQPHAAHAASSHPPRPEG